MTDRETIQQRRVKIAKGFQFIVYCWAMRLGVAAIGTVLVSFFQFIVPSRHGALKLQHFDTKRWASVVKDNYEHMREQLEPVLYLHIGAISSELLKSKFLRVTPIESTVFKVSNSSGFRHYDDNRLWSDKYFLERGYTYQAASSHYIDMFMNTDGDPHRKNSGPADGQESNVCVMNAAGEKENCQESEHYVYGTHSNALPHLPALSPAFAQYISLESSTPQVCMWFSSANVTAELHFDLNDNFLLQVSGEKAVMIVSPEAVSLLNPYSSWHPQWRQAFNASGLRTAKDILLHLDEALRAAAAMQVSVNTTHPTPSPSTPLNSGSASTAFGEVKVWEATLRAGDAVFIPAGYYHSVTALTGSLSVNAWFHSEFSDLYTQLENCPLPFTHNEGLAMKVTHLAGALRAALGKLEISVEDYGAVEWRRYQELVTEEDAERAEGISYDGLLCGGLSENEHISDSEERSSALCIIGAITTRPRVSKALAVTALMDYTEEILHLVWGDHLPRTTLAVAFVESCILRMGSS